MPRNDDTASRRTVLKSLGATGAALTGVGTAAGRPGRGRGPPEDDPGGGRGPPGGSPPGQPELTILHDTHVHGRFEDAGEYETIEHYFGLMDHLADDAERVLRLGSGDDLGSSALSTEFEGEHIVEAFEAGGLAHDTYGNHDFDFGPDVLRERVAGTEGFRWVSANVEDTRTGEVFAREQGARRFDLVDVEQVSVGITGMLTTRAREVTNLGENAEVLDPVDAIADVVPEMEAAGADVIVVLSHVANDVAREVAQAVDGLDVIVGDDAAEVLGDEVVNDTVLAFVGDGYDHLGEITLDLRGNHVHDYDFTMYETNAAVPELGVEPDAAVADVANDYREEVDVEVIGRSEVELNCRGEDLRTGETNMGNFVADAIREEVDADLAIQNGGGLRTDTLYPDGEITDLMIAQILPFGNSVLALEVDGATIREALENGVSEVDTLEGRFPQVSGVNFTWDPEADAGNRVTEVTVGGDPLDDGATYRLGTNNFLAGGGDAYAMLTDAETIAEGGTLADVVVDRIQALSPIAPEVEGRITRTENADTNAAMVGAAGLLG